MEILDHLSASIVVVIHVKTKEILENMKYYA